MITKIATIAVLATLFAYATGNYDRTKIGSERDRNLEAGGEFIDRSNEHEDSISEEGGGCSRNIDNSNNHDSYERIEPYERGSRHSSKTSASASADASSNAYDHGHKDRIFL